MSDLNSLKKKLNEIMDYETEKDYTEMNEALVYECSDMLLRTVPPEEYTLTKEEFRNSVAKITGTPPTLKAVSRKKLAVILVAAILLLALAVSAIAYGQQKLEFISHPDHFSLVADKPRRASHVGALTVGYLPDGFEQCEISQSTYSVMQRFSCGEKSIMISKESFYGNVCIDNENGAPHKETVNGAEFIIAGTEGSNLMAVWIKNKNLYIVSGDIGKDDLIKIALSVR